MEKVFLFIALVFSAGVHAETMPERFARVKAVADEVCSITNVVFCSGDEKPQVDVLAQWAAADATEVAGKDGFVRIDFVLKPEKGSDIRCCAVLPKPEKWDGRLWGQGNSGHAGVVPRISRFAKWGSAAVTTDLGTWAYTGCGKFNSKPWPKCVIRDFDWRATHLMTVYGRKLVKAFYGREAKWRYFNGGSTGGRQAFSEALRYPADYHGIIANLPANNAICIEADVFALRKLTHDDAGHWLFTTNDMRVLADAAVAYRAKTDPAPYAGKILNAPFFGEKDIDGFLAFAAKQEPKFAQPDLHARLRRIYLGYVHNGRRLVHGETPGVYLGKQMGWIGLVHFIHYLNANKISVNSATFDDFEKFAAEYGPSYNACSDNLDEFRRLGGKLFVPIGLEDQTTPSPEQIAHFERVVKRAGGDLKGVMEFYRVFPIPGCAHGGGRGRAMTCPANGPDQWKQLIAWREKGVAPERIETTWRNAGGLKMPVAAYPKRLEQDASGKWIEKTFDRTAVKVADELYLRCDLKPWERK